MSGDERPGTPPSDDDVVVPHPFGGGAPADGPVTAEPEIEANPEPEPAADAETVPETPEAEVSEPEVSEPEVSEPEVSEPEVSEPEVEEPEVEETKEPEEEPEPAGEPPAAVPPRRRRRDPMAAALIGVLTLLLGFAFAVQVRSTGDDQFLAGAREEDLVGILDSLDAQETRLREQIAEQRSALQQLTSSGSQNATALQEARRRAEAIGILNGTIPAHGPGLVMTIRDPEKAVRVADILDAIQELRGAGAETMQIDGVRVGVSTAVTGQPGGLMIDGRPITAPYEFIVIGSPQNMETAMNIPGGVVPRITGRGGSAPIDQSDDVVVDALRPLDTPQYASPDTGG